MGDKLQEMEKKLQAIVSRHLAKVLEFAPYDRYEGIKNKADFIGMIAKDAAFAPFYLAREKYAVARVGGNLITSLHRKLGDLYEDVTKEVISTVYRLPRSVLEYSLELKINSEIQRRSTDGKIRIDEVADPVLRQSLTKLIEHGYHGVALEVRSCYQIGDSKRIQADRDMALALRAIKLEPIMLIFCETSLRSPVIRLKAYWNLKEGQDAFAYFKALTGYDLQAFFSRNQVLIQQHMEKIFSSF